MTNRELLKRLQELETAERDVASSMDMPQENTANWAYAETAAIARSAILQYQEEIERLQSERAAAIDRLTPLGCENGDLRKALETYGSHNIGCPKAGLFPPTEGVGFVCTCGFEKACLREPQEAKHE